MKKSLLISLMVCCSIPGVYSKSNKTKPNIIFILVDDMGWGDLGVYYQNQRKENNDRSEPWEYTPNLDIMASEGAVLTQHYCAAPVCAPSRASILLGVSQGHANVRNNQFDKALEDNYTIASTLKQIGYSTVAIGKWGLQGLDHEGPNWPGHPLNRGFDYFLGYMRHKDGHEHYPKEGLYDGPKEVWENRINIVKGLDKCYTADLWTAAAKKWIVDHEKNKKVDNPFFMYLAYDTPHAVLELPTQAYPEGGGINSGMQWSDQKGHMINTASGEVDSWIHPDYARATWDDDKNSSTPEVPWPEVYKRYATATRRIDAAVGDIIQLLKDLKIDENTIIVFTSDNGPSRESYLPKNYQPNTPDFFNSFGPFDGIKRDCWEGGVRMPALVRWKGHILPHKITSPNISYDWAPTFLDAAGSPAPARMDGVSLMPSLKGKGTSQDQVIYIEYFHLGKTPDYQEFNSQHSNRRRNQMQVIRKDSLVGVRYDIHSAKDDFEIYNIVEDPRETKNLARLEGTDSLQQWMKHTVLGRRRPDSSAVRPYDDDPIPAVMAEETQNGVKWKNYKGPFSWVPQINSLPSLNAGISSRPEPEVINGRMLMYFEGYLKVPKDGEYTFLAKANGKALLKIHDVIVIDADYGYDGEEERKGMIKLQKGLHPYKLYYLKGANGNSLSLTWSGPDFSIETIPSESFVIETQD